MNVLFVVSSNLFFVLLQKDLIMFVGIDTHHDPSRKKKSVMSLVASLDNYCTQYYSRIVNQTPHQESSDAIKPVFTQALQAFYEVISNSNIFVTFKSRGITLMSSGQPSFPRSSCHLQRRRWRRDVGEHPHF